MAVKRKRKIISKIKRHKKENKNINTLHKAPTNHTQTKHNTTSIAEATNITMENGYEINVKYCIQYIMKGSFRLNVTLDTFIGEMKLIIKQKFGIPLEFQRLLFNGKELNDAYTFRLYNITEKSKSQILLFLELSGGGKRKKKTPAKINGGARAGAGRPKKKYNFGGGNRKSAEKKLTKRKEYSGTLLLAQMRNAYFCRRIKKLNKMVTSVIKQLKKEKKKSAEKDSRIFVLEEELGTVLDNDQIETLLKKSALFDDEKRINQKQWRTLLYFIYEDNMPIIRAQKAVHRSAKIWAEEAFEDD
eukprot:53354_1